ncbi:hypothetical protein [Desulfuromonas acetoxidans]|uniref:Uncharacterized protein n=1 Tax=Desulfuromonas acetoxidans (strain DSM 684 / 11070) TaxID=281689 RepID=Q1JWY9_DESA6|nr:hypothetical protein [Desulfuromonas acetoxidans]EAT14769.1 hypothetical protein Dace_0823 [Desulfuromonas acetoxidans DSM 684]MBF0645843.1 hypothetical protein [Desulfuromonas acetoxidans]NVD25023.1 hypothetical protein [Desulfuromonas acetoxidans]NVE17068.1 hypothetical protein [Desulfuromonas acetoxidans]
MVKIIFYILAIVILLTFFFFGGNVSFSEQWPLYESLRNTAAIIFGVMGAWIAIIYPKALTNILKSRDTKDNAVEAERVKKLIAPMVYSTAILSIVLLVGLFAPVLKQIQLAKENYVLIRQLSFSMLGLLTYIQLWSLILTLIPCNVAQGEVQKGKAKREALDRKFKPK